MDRAEAGCGLDLVGCTVASGRTGKVLGIVRTHAGGKTKAGRFVIEALRGGGCWLQMTR